MKRFAVTLTVLLVSAAGGAHADESEPGDAASVRAAVETLAAALDGQHAKATSWDGYVVAAYRSVLGRDPEVWEFKTAQGLRDDIGLTPSHLAGLLLRDETGRPSWDKLRAFAAGFRPEQFEPTDVDLEKARALASAPLTLPTEQQTKSAPLSEPPKSLVPNDVYNTYFGNVHAHSQLSDGVGTPAEAYAYARDVAHLDFFSLSDHGEFLLIWPWENKWQQLYDAAQASDRPGQFAALWGFEWSNPLLGHINVINAQGFTDCLFRFWPGDLFNWMNAQPQCFGMFNHPHELMWAGPFIFDFFRFDQAALNQMVGMELASYYTLGAVLYRVVDERSTNVWDLANGEGWRLGALGNQDNHAADWGTFNHVRTGVLARELTRDAIAEAYHQRRFYVTEDKDLKLDFRCNGYPMGARIAVAQRTFEVTAQDGSGDTFEEIRLYRNGTLLETRPVEGNPVSASFEDAAGAGDCYYYVVARQADDEDGSGRNDEAVSSPIWLVTPNGAGAGCIPPGADAKTSESSLADALLCAAMMLACCRGVRRKRRWK